MDIAVDNTGVRRKIGCASNPFCVTKTQFAVECKSGCDSQSATWVPCDLQHSETRSVAEQIWVYRVSFALF